MARLRSLKPRLQEFKPKQPASLHVVAERRMAGRKLQDRRMAVWSRDPCCAMCGKLCEFPSGFELDHKMPLYLGGPDTEENCQVLCVSWKFIDGRRVKLGCHALKTAADSQA